MRNKLKLCICYNLSFQFGEFLVLVKVLVMIFVAVNVALNKPSYKQNHFNQNYNIGDYMCI